MNCAKCGNILPPNVLYCPVCNEPTGIHAGYGYPQPDGMAQTGSYAPIQPTGSYAPVQPSGFGGYPPQDYAAQGYQPQGGAYQPQQSQPSNGVYQQSYSQYGVGVYPPGYQPPYQYGQPDTSVGNRFMAALSELPHTFVDSLLRPSEALRKHMESRDRLACLIVAGAALLLSFLFGMALVRGFIGALMTGIASLTGVSLAGDAASFNQGISYITGRISPGIGGIAALCQIIALLVPTFVAMAYLCVICKARFSSELFLGYLSVNALPVCGFLLIMILLSFISPWPALLPLVCSAVVTYAQMGALLAFVTGRSEAQLLPARLVCYSISILLTVMLISLVGGALIGGVFERIFAMLGSVGSLI